jgi:hypothetical protein
MINDDFQCCYSPVLPKNLVDQFSTIQGFGLEFGWKRQQTNFNTRENARK